jgi:hypothetical protein
MPTTSIKISQLDPIASLTGSDFFPIDQSSSIKTYRASLTQLQNLFSTGSFTGSVIGTIVGTGTSPQFVGTSSWAISSSRSISSSYSDFSNSSSYALSSSNAVTASYALNSSAGTLFGGGIANYIPIWTNSTTLGSTNDFYAETGYFTSTRDLKIQKSNPALFVTGSDLGYVAVRCTYNSSLMLQSAQSASRDSWALIVNADDANAAFLAATPLTAYDIRGTIDLVSYSGSSQFVSKQVTGEATPVSYVMKSRSNGLYFWPEKGAQSLSRDGTFNIGVSPSTINTSSRLTIEVFSGSSASNPQTYHLSKAIEVRYGSSSLNTTFCVSSSGQVIATGYSGSNFNAVSFYGSASYALSSSNAVTASYALSSSNAVTASYALSSNNGASVQSHTSTLTVNNYYSDSYYTASHGLGRTPYLTNVKLACITNDSSATGYIIGDEVSAESFFIQDFSDGTIASDMMGEWSNSTYIGVTFMSPYSGLANRYVFNKTGNITLFDATAAAKFKIKIYYM